MDILNLQQAAHHQGTPATHSRLWKCEACQGVLGFAAPAPQPVSCGLCGNVSLQPVKS